MDKGIKAEDLVCMMPSTTTVYSVRRVQQECDCKLCCGLCEACVHMCTCTCIDSAVDSTVCKHVHIVHMTELSERTQFPSTRHSLQSPLLKLIPSMLIFRVRLLNRHHPQLLNSNRIFLYWLQTITEDTSDVAILKAGISHVTSFSFKFKAHHGSASARVIQSI